MECIKNRHAPVIMARNHRTNRPMSCGPWGNAPSCQTATALKHLLL